MKHQFSADRAIEEVSEDRLGRSAFASHLAAAVSDWTENDSLVLALYGEWGAGKTSVKNLFKCHCKGKGDPYVVEFNPWQWSAQDKIFEAFFKIIGNRLGYHDVAQESKQLAKKWKYFGASWEIGSELVKSVKDAALQFILLATVAGWLTTIHGGVVRVLGSIISITSLLIGGLAIVLPGLFAKVTAFFEAKAHFLEKDLEQRRSELIKELKKLTKPIIVIIDDIDRLNHDEIRLVIQLVKANSDLPKVVYFLLFQQETVVKALQEISHQKGSEFLEKIVQVGFDIPQAHEAKLQGMLIDGLNEVFSGIDLGARWNKERWESIFGDHLKYFFRTPRDVYRFLGMLQFHAKIHKNNEVFEVNPIDLIALEALRVFVHPVYEQIKDSFVVYTDVLLRTLYFSRKKSEKIELDVKMVVEKVDDGMKKHVEAIVFALFPQLSPGYSSNDDGSWNKDLRICDKNHFSKYFELSLREGTISEFEVSSLLKSASDPKTVSDALNEHIKRGQIDDLLDRLEQHSESIPHESIEGFLTGILSVSDNFPVVRKGLFDFPPEVKTARLTRRLLLKVPEIARADFMIKVFSTSGALRVPTMILDSEDRSKSDNSQKLYLLNDSDLKRVQQSCIETIKAASMDGRLQTNDQFVILLQQWNHWSGTKDASVWADSFVKDIDSAMTITLAAVNVSTMSNHRGIQHVDALLLKWLEQFVSLEKVWGFLSVIDKTTMDQRRQHIIELFGIGLQKKTKGEPYDQISDNNRVYPPE